MLKALFERESLIPTFSLPEASGQFVNTAYYKQRKNVVLVFLHSCDCEFCQRVVRAFKFFASRYKEENTEVIFVLPDKCGEAQDLKTELGIPFKVLADEKRNALQKFIEVPPEEDKPLVAVLVVDRFGALLDQWYSFGEEIFPDQQRFLTSLVQAEIECPECGIHEWPT